MKKIFALLFVLFSFSFLSIYSQDMNPDAGKLYNEGNSLLKAGNYNGAIQKYDEALKIAKDYRILYQKGLALRKADKLSDAKLALEESLQLSPNNEAALNALGGVFFAMKDYLKSIETFEKVLNVSKNNSFKDKVKKNMSLAYTQLGNEAMKGGNAAKAIEYLNKAVELDKYDSAFLLLAQLNVELGNYDAAIKAAEDALKYRNKITKGGPNYYIALAYKNKGDMAKAKEYLNLAKTDPAYKSTAEYQLNLLK
jgi:tetratricopeptide (TPR) repeat protein